MKHWSYLSLVVLFFLLASASFADSARTPIPGPAISQITPVSFVATWNPPDQYDYSTHYQLRLNGYLYYMSTQKTSLLVNHLVPGNGFSVDYVIYHQGKILGISSATSVLLCPSEPSGLFADNIGTTSFRLRWVPVNTATEYNIFADGILKTTVPATQTTALVTGLQPGTKVKVTMTARNASGDSFHSKYIEVTLLPNPPILLVLASEIEQTSFMARWTLVEGAASYTVYRNATAVQTLGSTTTNVLVEGCTPGTYTTTKVQASNASGYSEFSNELKVLTKPATPIRPIAYSIGTNSFYLEWIAVDGAKGYKIYRDSDWLLYNLSSTTNRVLCNRGFNPGETASMSVSCYNATGDTPQSDALAVKLLSLSSGTASLTPILPLISDSAHVPIGTPISDFTLFTTQSRGHLFSSLFPNTPKLLVFLNASSRETIDRWARECKRLETDKDLAHLALITVLVGPEAISLLPKFKSGYVLKNEKITPLISTNAFPTAFILDRQNRVRGIERELSHSFLKNRLIFALSDAPEIQGNLKQHIEHHRQTFERLHEPPNPR